MELEQLKALFPVTVNVTQEMIDEGRANLYSTRNCIGALTLKSLIPEKLHEGVWWGVGAGGVGEYAESLESESVLITTSPWVDMMEIIEPTKVTLKVGSNLEYSFK